MTPVKMGIPICYTNGLPFLWTIRLTFHWHDAIVHALPLRRGRGDLRARAHDALNETSKDAKRKRAALSPHFPQHHTPTCIFIALDCGDLRKGFSVM